MKIIGISGRKQSGKNTVANFINGHILKQRNMINEFVIDENGMLIISTQDSSGNSGFGIFDVTRKDDTFIEYAERNLWPYVKVYHFADPLKELSINLFGLKAEEIYGNDIQKNQSTDILWENMPENITNKTGNITNREFLEHFGTCIIRKIKTNAWSEYTINKIIKEQSEIAIIPDVRFPNEIEAIKKHGGKIIRLTRNIHNSNAEAEIALDNVDENVFDLVIDNSNVTLPELCQNLNELSYMWSE